MRDLALAIIIFGLLPLCLMRPWIGILVWYWFGIMNPHRHTFQWAFDMPWAMLIGGATLLGALFAKDRKPIPWTIPLVVMVILMGYFTLTTYVAWAPEFAWMQWNKVAKILLMTIVATMFIYGKDRIRALMLVVAFSIGFYGVKGTIFTLRSGGVHNVEGPPGSFLEGNTFIGLAMNMVLPVLVYLAREEQRPWLRRLLYFTAIMTVPAIVFTYSRGAWLGLAAVVPLVFLHFKRKWIVAVVLVPILAAAPLILPERIYDRAETISGYEKDVSANQRLQSWTVAWNLARAHPLTGAGFEFEYGDSERWLEYADDKYAWALTRSSAAHSIYFQILGQHGFVATFLYVILLVGTLLTLQRVKMRAALSQEQRWLASYASALQIGMIGFMVSGAFLSSAYFDLAWLYFALSAILAREVKQGATSATEARSSSTPHPAGLRGAVPKGAPYHRLQ